MRAVLKGEQAADVPCDGCVGCCVSSYAIPLRPEDKGALAAVPARYLSLPVNGGLARMRHRDDGSCPMLEAGRCTIYADRPPDLTRLRLPHLCGHWPAAGWRASRDPRALLEWNFAFVTEQESGAARCIGSRRAIHPAECRVVSSCGARGFRRRRGRARCKGVAAVPRPRPPKKKGTDPKIHPPHEQVATRARSSTRLRHAIGVASLLRLGRFGDHGIGHVLSAPDRSARNSIV